MSAPKVTIKRTTYGWDVLADGAVVTTCASRREAQYEQDMARIRFAKQQEANALASANILMHKTADDRVRCYATSDYEAGTITVDGTPVAAGPFTWVLIEYRRMANLLAAASHNNTQGGTANA